MHLKLSKKSVLLFLSNVVTLKMTPPYWALCSESALAGSGWPLALLCLQSQPDLPPGVHTATEHKFARRQVSHSTKFVCICTGVGNSAIRSSVFRANRDLLVKKSKSLP